MKQTFERITVGTPCAVHTFLLVSQRTLRKEAAQRGRPALNEPDLGFGSRRSPRIPSQLPLESAGIWNNGGTIQVLRLPVSTVSSGRIDARRIAAECFSPLTDSLFRGYLIYGDETDITRTWNEWGAPTHSTVHRPKL